MYTIKSGWAVQTFALAKCNESEGRKSRIRRSKEERKAMVESFIKTYQISNNGNFPSLNLTHKEVGGSFYTVREIVREVIQENRVLGPAKLTPEEQKLLNADQLLEQYPLGSISYEPQISLTPSSNETHFGPDHQSTSGKVIITTNGCILNGSQVELKSEEAEDVKYIQLQASDPSEVKKNDEKEMVASKAKMNLLVREPSEAEESLKDKTGPPKAKVNAPEFESLEAKENLEEKTVPPKAKVNLLEVEPTEAKDNLEEAMVTSNARTNSPVSEPLEVKDILEEKLFASKTKVLPLPAKAVAETFPLRRTTKSSDSLDAMLGDVKDSTISFEKTEAEEVELGSPDITSWLVGEVDAENGSVVQNSQGDTNGVTYEPHSLDAMLGDVKDSTISFEKTEAEEVELGSPDINSGLVGEVNAENGSVVQNSQGDTNGVTYEPHSLDAMLGDVKDSTISFEKTEAEEVELGSPDINSGLVGEVDAENGSVVHNSQGDTNAVTYEPRNEKTMVCHNDRTEANDQSQTVAEVKAISAPNGAPTTKYPKVASMESKTIVGDDKAETKPSVSSKKGRNSTLDRINLETWEGPSRTSGQFEKNPLLAIFKSFITAFVKFWSE